MTTYKKTAHVAPETRKLPPARPRTRIVAPSAPVNENERANDCSPMRDYPVGKGKPPVHTRFLPGQSGNPAGRPRGAKSMKTMVRKHLTAPMTINTAEGRKRISRAEMLILKLIEKAAKGDLKAMQALLRYYEQFVPDDAPKHAEPTALEDLTATDIETLAILAELLRSNDNPDGGGHEPA